MRQWLIMKTLGFLKDPLFYLRILATCSVLSTGLLIKNQVSNTSDANTSGKKENPEVQNVELRQRVIGKNIMDHVQNSNKILNSMVRNPFQERFSACIPPKGE